MWQIAITAETALDRLSQSLGSETVFPHFVQIIGQYLGLNGEKAWQVKYAGLSAVASLAEGCREGVEERLEWVMG